jgi:hypothetical protein
MTPNPHAALGGGLGKVAQLARRRGIVPFMGSRDCNIEPSGCNIEPSADPELDRNVLEQITKDRRSYGDEVMDWDGAMHMLGGRRRCR